jgi:hypothetical protein
VPLRGFELFLIALLQERFFISGRKTHEHAKEFSRRDTPPGRSAFEWYHIVAISPAGAEAYSISPWQ